ncbi:MAG: hypothetical protein U5N21_17340 [Rhodococcus sp. (in: high G+C Gram-positive bacteria)]|nr:hypothetical protein [Rhodococcus sp. (in: high G+C Gram-positive bacteria)]
MTSTRSELVGIERADRFVRDALDANGFHIVVGVNGSGRSAVLASVAASVDAYTGTIADAPSGSTVLVDDAHLLPEQRLDEIAAAATRSDITLIVATAPRSFDSRIEKLIASAGSNRLTLVPLDKVAIAARAAATARPISASLAGAIAKATGGILAAVDAALGALGGDRSDPAPLRVVTETVAEQHRRMLIETTDDTRALLLAARFGVTPDPASAAQIVPRATDVESIVDLACSSGMLDTTGTLIPSAEAPLIEMIGDGRCRVLLSAVTDVATRSRLLDATAARALAERGVVHAGLADLPCPASRFGPCRSRRCPVRRGGRCRASMRWCWLREGPRSRRPPGIWTRLRDSPMWFSTVLPGAMRRICGRRCACRRRLQRNVEWPRAVRSCSRGSARTGSDPTPCGPPSPPRRPVIAPPPTVRSLPCPHSRRRRASRRAVCSSPE